MGGVQTYKAHALKHIILYELYIFICDVLLTGVAPPDKHVGIFQQLLAYSLIFHIKGGAGDSDIILHTEKIRNAAVYSLGIYLCNALIFTFVNIFVPYCNSYHQLFPPLKSSPKR